MLQCKSLGYVAFPRCSCKTMYDCLSASSQSLRKTTGPSLGTCPYKMYIAQSRDWNVQRKLHIHQQKKRKKTKNKKKERKENPIAILQEKSVSHSIHTKCFQIVHKYQRHYERFFGDETKVQESQGNRANERKQSSSCLCFLKDNQTSQPRRFPRGTRGKFTSQLSLSGQKREPFLAQVRPNEPGAVINHGSVKVSQGSGNTLQKWIYSLLSNLFRAEAALTAENFGPRDEFQANAKIWLLFIQGIQQY